MGDIISNKKKFLVFFAVFRGVSYFFFSFSLLWLFGEWLLFYFLRIILIFFISFLSTSSASSSLSFSFFFYILFSFFTLWHPIPFSLLLYSLYFFILSFFPLFLKLAFFTIGNTEHPGTEYFHPAPSSFIYLQNNREATIMHLTQTCAS